MFVIARRSARPGGPPSLRGLVSALACGAVLATTSPADPADAGLNGLSGSGLLDGRTARYIFPDPAHGNALVWIEALTSADRVAPSVLPGAAGLGRMDTSGRLRRACVRIISPGRHGTGFFIAADGLLLTSYHVVAGAPWLMLQTAAGQVFSVDRVEAFSHGSDLALLKVESPSPFTFLPVGDVSSPVPAAQRVSGVGHPGDEAWVEFEGRSAGRIDLGRRAFLSFDAPLAPGSSGGPVLDESGRFQGVAAYTAIYPDGTRRRLAVPADVVRSFLARRARPTPLGDLARYHAEIAQFDLAAAAFAVADTLMASLPPGGRPAREPLPGAEPADQIVALSWIIEARLMPRAARCAPVRESLTDLHAAMTQRILALADPADSAPGRAGQGLRDCASAYRRGLDGLLAVAGSFEREGTAPLMIDYLRTLASRYPDVPASPRS